MIERLTGKLIVRSTSGVIIDVQGVGYGVEVPLSLLSELPAIGSNIDLWIYTHVREDLIKLYGFSAFEDRQTFGILLEVSGVGPKVALAMLSTLTVSALKQAVLQQNIALLEVVPGIGARTAEKILVELKSKMKKLQNCSASLNDVAKKTEDGDVKTSDNRETASALGDRQRRIDADSVDHVLQDVQSALENLGFKERDVVPIIQKLTVGRSKDNHEHDGAENKLEFNGLLKLALRELGAVGLGKNSN